MSYHILSIFRNLYTSGYLTSRTCISLVMVWAWIDLLSLSHSLPSSTITSSPPTRHIIRCWRGSHNESQWALLGNACSIDRQPGSSILFVARLKNPKCAADFLTNDEAFSSKLFARRQGHFRQCLRRLRALLRRQA